MGYYFLPDEEELPIVEEKGTGYIYFVAEEDTGRVKIGYTCGEIKHRLNKLRAGSSHPLCVIGYIKTKNNEHAEYERFLHRKFRHLNIWGEWFSPGAELIHHFNKIATRTDEKLPYPWDRDLIEKEKNFALKEYLDAS